MKLIKTFVLGTAQTNCYIIKHQNQYILIDCGENPKVIIEFCQEQQITINTIIITHTHFDHIAGLEQVVNAFAIKNVYLPPKEINFITDQQKNLAVYFNATVTYTGPREIFTQELAGEFGIKLFYISGHSCESLAFYFKQDNVLFSGDSVFLGSVGRSDLEYGNSNTLLKDIKIMLDQISNETKIYPGHGMRTTKANEIKTNPHLLR